MTDGCVSCKGEDPIRGGFHVQCEWIYMKAERRQVPVGRVIASVSWLTGQHIDTKREYAKISFE